MYLGQGGLLIAALVSLLFEKGPKKKEEPVPKDKQAYLDLQEFCKKEDTTRAVVMVYEYKSNEPNPSKANASHFWPMKEFERMNVDEWISQHLDHYILWHVHKKDLPPDYIPVVNIWVVKKKAIADSLKYLLGVLGDHYEKRPLELFYSNRDLYAYSELYHRIKNLSLLVEDRELVVFKINDRSQPRTYKQKSDFEPMNLLDWFNKYDSDYRILFFNEIGNRVYQIGNPAKLFLWVEKK